MELYEELLHIKHHKFKCYYVDYLCVHKDYRKQGYAEKMIQTHAYYQEKHGNLNISLFKKENNLHLIVPLIVYKTYKFNMETWENTIVLPTHMTVIPVDKSNIYTYWQYIKDREHIPSTILCSLSSFINL